MANPKLLQEITIDSTCDVLGFDLGGAQTATITPARYDTILEVLAELQTQLQVVDASFAVAVTSLGIVSITCANAWTVDWATTDDGLEALLGFDGTETVQGGGPGVLTASLRHLYGWYAPVGVEYPGIRRRVARRYQETDDGSASAYASAATHRYVTLTFDACLESQIEPEKAEVADDGAGGTVDWTSRTFFDFWSDVAAKHFRFYEDGSYGTVSNVTGYWQCYRTDDEIEPAQLDPQGYTYFRVVLPCQIVSIVDYVAPPAPPASAWVHDGVRLVDGIAAIAWTALGVSGLSDESLVLLHAYCAGVDAWWTKPGGAAGTWGQTYNASGGASHAGTQVAGITNALMVHSSALDADYKCQVANPITIDQIGHVPFTAVTGGAKTGTAPTTFATATVLDWSAKVPISDALGICVCRRTGGFQGTAYLCSGDETLESAYGFGGLCGNPAIFLCDVNAYLIDVVRLKVGVAKCWANAAINYEIDLVGYIPITKTSLQIFSGVAPDTSWHEYDVSSVAPDAYNLVECRFRRNAGPASIWPWGLRPGADTIEVVDGNAHMGSGVSSNSVSTAGANFIMPGITEARNGLIGMQFKTTNEDWTVTVEWVI